MQLADDGGAVVPAALVQVRCGLVFCARACRFEQRIH